MQKVPAYWCSLLVLAAAPQTVLEPVMKVMTVGATPRAAYRDPQRSSEVVDTYVQQAEAYLRLWEVAHR